MYMNFILILSLFISVYSTPTLTLRYTSGKDLDRVVLYKDYDSFPAVFRCSIVADWVIVPDLPKGMFLDGSGSIGVIYNKPTELSPETKYTVTAITNEGNVSLSFTMKVASCESHKLYHFTTVNEITLSSQGKNISIYSDKWECLDPLVYDFYIAKIDSKIVVTDVNDT